MAVNRIRMRDIAERVGVHPSTVSRVLNPEKRKLVSEKVARQITETAQQLGYTPHPGAYGLRTGRSWTIGVIVSDITNPAFSRIIRGIEDRLIETGYMAIICSSDQIPDRKKRIVEIMRSRQFDGVILATTERDDLIFKACREDHIPAAYIERGSGPADISAVQMNDKLGMQFAIEHLVSLGHQRIALISGPQRFSGAFGRHRNAIRAMAECGIKPEPALTTFCENYSVADGRRSCRALFASGEKFTAVVTPNDLIALGCCDVIKFQGLSCPDDISVIGYNSQIFTAKVDPPLTSIKFPNYRCGQAVAQLLLDQIEKPSAPASRALMQPTLIVRRSTALARS